MCLITCGSIHQAHHGLVTSLEEDKRFLCLAALLCEQFCRFANEHRRTSQGGEGGCSPPPPQLQKFLKYFGQNADDSGNSTREKIL